MTIDDEKLDELERCAEAATEGPWMNEFEGVYQYPSHDKVKMVATAEREEMFPEMGSRPADIDAMYIAAADPPTVLSMVKEVRRLREERDRYQQALVDIYHGMHPGQGTRDVAEEALEDTDE